MFVGSTVEGDCKIFPVIRPGFFKFFKKFSPGRALPPVRISVRFNNQSRLTVQFEEKIEGRAQIAYFSLIVFIGAKKMRIHATKKP